MRRPFTTRFETNARGDIYLIGNTSLRADPSDPDATNAQNGIGARINNNHYNMVNVDVDVDGTTFNSSSANFTIPAGCEVLWAGLYWGADTENANGTNPPDMSKRNQVLFSTGGVYQTIFSAIPLDEDASGIRYQGFSDVTSLVRLQTAGSSQIYTVANIQAVTGTGPSHYAGWSLVIVLKNPTESIRHLHVFDGFAVVTGTGSVNTNVSGFRSPPSGIFATHIGMVAYEGDLGTAGDSFQVNGTAIEDPLNPLNNFFNSSITRLGSQIANKIPNYVNQLGFDTNTVDIPYSSGIIANGASSANLTFSTNGDWYYSGVLTFGIDIYMPIIAGNVIKTMTDLNGGTLHPGDLIEFTISVTNTGNDNAVDVVLRDSIPSFTNYVPGSLQVVSGANAGSKSDSTGDDQAEYEAGNNRVVFRLGAGADDANGGTLAYTESTVVSFQVQVDAEMPNGASIENTASVDYMAFTTGEVVTANSNTISVNNPNNADLSVTKTVDEAVRDEGETINYMITLTNNGPNGGTNITITDQLPEGVVYVADTPSQGSYNSDTGIWTVGDLANGASAILSITATVAAATAGATITNIATLTAVDQNDSNSTNNQDSADIMVTTPAPGTAQLDINKSSDAGGFATPGATITYTINVNNTGTVPLSGITVTDALPAETAYVVGSSQVTAPGSVSQTVRDEFNSISYAGNNGTQNWSNSWQELGESDGPNTGHVEADTRPAALEIGGRRGTNITGDGASRAADLSGAVSATLSLDVWRSGSSSRGVTLAVWDDGAGSWFNLQTYPHSSPTPTVQTTEIFDLTPYVSANTQIRFMGSGRSMSTSYIYFDNVQIDYVVSGPPATNPGGSPPNLASGYNLGPGEQMTVTFQVTVNDSFDDPNWTVENTATAASHQTGSKNSNTVVDPVGVPNILVLKSMITSSDPVNDTTNPKAIPDASVIYTIGVTNQGNRPTDIDTVMITDAVPANTSLFVGDLDGSGSPLHFVDSATVSGLTYTFTSLADNSDDIAFSNDGGETFNYTPVPDGDGFDGNVTHLRINPKGAFSGTFGGNYPGFELKFKVRVD